MAVTLTPHLSSFVYSLSANMHSDSKEKTLFKCSYITFQNLNWCRWVTKHAVCLRNISLALLSVKFNAHSIVILGHNSDFLYHLVLKGVFNTFLEKMHNKLNNNTIHMQLLLLPWDEVVDCYMLMSLTWAFSGCTHRIVRKQKLLNMSTIWVWPITFHY